MAKEEQAPAPAKKLPIKSILIVAIILLAEGGLFAVWMMVSEPESAVADTAVIDDQVKAVSAELNVLENLRVPNRRSGRLMMYDLQVAIELDPARVAAVTELIKAHEIRIRDAVYTIIAQAEPYYFEEPDRQTLKRQIHAALEEMFGEGTVKRVLIPDLVGFRGE